MNSSSDAMAVVLEPDKDQGSEAGRAVTITAWWILPDGWAELDAVEQLIGRRFLRSEPCGRAGA